MLHRLRPQIMSVDVMNRPLTACVNVTMCIDCILRAAANFGLDLLNHGHKKGPDSAPIK